MRSLMNIVHSYLDGYEKMIQKQSGSDQDSFRRILLNFTTKKGSKNEDGKFKWTFK